MSASSRIAHRVALAIGASAPAPSSQCSRCIRRALPPSFLMPAVSVPSAATRRYSSMPAFAESDFDHVPIATPFTTMRNSSNVISVPRVKAAAITEVPVVNKPVPAAQVDSSEVPRRKVTIQTLQRLKRQQTPIAMLTAHDYPTSVLADAGGIDICLVGDSLAMVALGYEDTTQLTVDEMLHHCRAVSRGAKHAFKVGDMVFGSYTSPEDGVRNAIRLIKEGKMEAVKLEGGAEMVDTIKAITRIGVPVMGHIGLTPQKFTALGGYRVQGKTAAKAKVLLEDALALQEAGCFALIIEAVPAPVAEMITERLKIPTIGIGAGNRTSGQVLVALDMLGMGGAKAENIFSHAPKFCKIYEQFGLKGIEAVKQYAADVRSSSFPQDGTHTYPMKEEEIQKLRTVKDAYPVQSRVQEITAML